MLPPGRSASRVAHPQRALRGGWIVFIGLAAAALFGAVAARLYRLQALEHPVHALAVADDSQGLIRLAPRRGAIVDARGRPLVVSLDARSCAIDPSLILRTPGAHLAGVLGHLSETIDLANAEYDQVHDSIASHQSKYGTVSRFAWVRRRLSEADRERLEAALRDARREAAAARRRMIQLHRQEVQPATTPERRAELEYERWQLEVAALKAEARFAGVLLVEDERRQYPQGALAAHVLGLTRLGDNDELEGSEGLEKRFNGHLSGIKSARPVWRDRRRVRLAADSAPPPVEAVGQTVELTLDAVIQGICEEELSQAVAAFDNPRLIACAIVVEPETGDILAMANYPGFDPARPGRRSGAQLPGAYNYAASSVQEPGSVMKPFTFAAALAEGLIDPDEIFDCGPYPIADGRVIKDIHAFTRPMPARAILWFSSNPGIVRVGERVGRERLREYFAAFGFGQRTGDWFADEAQGQLKEARRWSASTMGSAPMGYEVAVTPLQIALAYCVFANGGWLPAPRLARTISNADGDLAEIIPVRMRRRVLSAETAQAMLDLLRQVVTEGTGRKANQGALYEMAGKTGTAELPVDDEEKARGLKNYSKERHVANFAVIAPYRAPKIVALVTIREAHKKYGGEIAAPAARNIVNRVLAYLMVPPDAAIDRTLASAPGAP